MPSVFQTPVPLTLPWSAAPRAGFPPSAGSAPPYVDPWTYAGCPGVGPPGPPLPQQAPPPPPPLPPRSQPSLVASPSPEEDVSRLSGVSGGMYGGESVSYFVNMSFTRSSGRVGECCFRFNASLCVVAFLYSCRVWGPEPSTLLLLLWALGVADWSLPQGDGITVSPFVGKVVPVVFAFLALLSGALLFLKCILIVIVCQHYPCGEIFVFCCYHPPFLLLPRFCGLFQKFWRQHLHPD